MPQDQIRYDILMQDALRQLVKKVIEEVAQTGMPGDHYFYLTFNTQAKGVLISPKLKATYPENMTIILQHQFWGLNVLENSFEICLSFNSIPEKLTIPFNAILSFIDPSVSFKLEFDYNPQILEENLTEDETDKTISAALNEQSADISEKISEKSDSGKVVSLSAFRNKTR